MEIQERRTRVLNDTINYYTEPNTDRRCLSPTGKCCYSGITAEKKSDGCAVGRLLDPDLREKLDVDYTLAPDDIESSVDDIWHELPESIKSLGLLFLLDLQGLHDTNHYWTDIHGATILTESGLNKVQQITSNIKENKY